MTSGCHNHLLVNPAIPGLLLLREFAIVWVLPSCHCSWVTYDWKSVLSGFPVHLIGEFGFVCEFAHPPLAISPPPHRPHWSRFQAILGKYGRALGQG